MRPSPSGREQVLQPYHHAVPLTTAEQLASFSRGIAKNTDRRLGYLLRELYVRGGQVSDARLQVAYLNGALSGLRFHRPERIHGMLEQVM